MQSKNLIQESSFAFALQIIEFSEELERKRKFVIGKQILKSGTSIGANIHEAQSAESRSDFIHKLKIASKEVAETEYWLNLCTLAKNYPTNKNLLNDLDSIKKVLNKIIASTIRNK